MKTPLSDLLRYTIFSAAAYAVFQLSYLVTNLWFLSGIDEMHAGTTKGQYIISFVFNLVVTGALYFWVYSLLKKGRNLGRILGTVAASVSAFGSLAFAVLVFGVAIAAAFFALVFVIVNILWLVKAWNKETSLALQ